MFLPSARTCSVLRRRRRTTASAISSPMPSRGQRPLIPIPLSGSATMAIRSSISPTTPQWSTVAGSPPKQEKPIACPPKPNGSTPRARAQNQLTFSATIRSRWATMPGLCRSLVLTRFPNNQRYRRYCSWMLPSSKLPLLKLAWPEFSPWMWPSQWPSPVCLVPAPTTALAEIKTPRRRRARRRLRRRGPHRSGP